MGDTVDTDTVTTEASVPLMLSPRLMPPLSLNPKLKPMPTTAMVTPDTVMAMPDTAMATPTLTDTPTTTSARGLLNPKLTTDTVDTEATATDVTDTTVKLLFRIKSLDIFQIWRILTTNSFSLFPSLQHLLVYICYVLVSVES